MFFKLFYKYSIELFYGLFFIVFSLQANEEIPPPDNCPKNVVSLEAFKFQKKIKENPTLNSSKYRTYSIEPDKMKAVSNKDGYYSASKSNGFSSSEYSYIVTSTPDEHEMRISLLDGINQEPESVSAAQSVRNTFFNFFESKKEITADDLRQMYQRAALEMEYIQEKFPGKMLKVSAISVLIKKDSAFIANIGDTQAIVFSRKTISGKKTLYAPFITKHHSDHTGRLTRSINPEQFPFLNLQVDVTHYPNLKPGDQILIMNKSAFQNVSFDKIHNILSNEEDAHLPRITSAIKESQSQNTSLNRGNSSVIVYTHTFNPTP